MIRGLPSLLVAAAALACAAAEAQPANARGWPDHAIRMIVPAGTGGVVDLRARWLAERLALALGQPMIVEDRPGAAGNIGMEAGARSAADGYTIVVVHQGTMAMNPHLYAHPGYDPFADFAPVTRIGAGPLVLSVNSAIPARSVEELIALAKAGPGALTFGSPGAGTPPHMAGELFKRLASIDITHVPYRGGGQAVSDLVAGHIAMGFDSLQVQLPFVRTGRLRPLAITGAHRSPALPEVPTMAEAGVTGYEFEGWVGIAVPAGTPASVVERLYREIAAILATPDAHAWFDDLGLDPGGEPPATFAGIIRHDYESWGSIIRGAGITAE